MNAAYTRWKQIYLGLIPAYPIGYILIHGFRGDQIWAKAYVDRCTVEPSDKLKELVESELDKLKNVRKAKIRIALTEELEPKVYGGLFLNTGAELQFPLRASLDDVEQAHLIGSNLEMDLGLSKLRRKVEVKSRVGDEIVSRLMLSDVAKVFIVQRQLQIANSGEFFAVPIIAWLGISTLGYALLVGSATVLGAPMAFCVSLACTVIAYQRFSRSFQGYQTRKADEMTVKRGETYLQGARDYLDTSMKLNRLLRSVLGEDGERNIDRNGDCRLHSVSYSVRRKLVDKIALEKSASAS